MFQYIYLKRFYLIISLLIGVMYAYADSRTLSDAMRIAKDFVQRSEGFGLGDANVEFTIADDGQKRAKNLKDGSSSDYFILNLSDADGYVIVSGDDRFRDVLGYSNEGGFSFDAMPDGLAYLLSAYSREMDAAKEYWKTNPLDIERSRSSIESYPSVPPLVKTHWCQNYPFNAQVPIDYSGSYSTYHGKAAIGCVALSMAQVMNYWKYPSQGSGGIYRDKYYDDIAVNFDEQTYNWNNVAAEYGIYIDDDGIEREATYTQAQADEIAKICYHAGVAVNMIWNVDGTGGSGAYGSDIVRALAGSFGYNRYAKLVCRDVVGVDAFCDMITRDLVSGRPVIFSADSDAGGGHSFLMDGYDASAHLFHVNWGWQGDDNGYYAISVLKPSGNIGNFIENQSAVLGLQPTEEDFGYTPTVYFSQATLKETSIQKGNSVVVEIPNLYCQDALLPGPIQIGLVVYDNNGIPVTDIFHFNLSPVQNYITVSFSSPVFQKSMSAGTYTMQVSMKDADGNIFPSHAYYGKTESWTVTVSSSKPNGTVSFVPIDPIATEIDSPFADAPSVSSDASSVWYTLTGIPVSVPRKGTYIRGGKKYLFR